jgi:hypothetical protein
MRQRFTYRLLVVCFLIISGSYFQSCQKELDFQPGDNVSPKNNFTVEGVITDNTGRPLQGVIVKAGNQQVITNANGSFRASNASFTTTETFITAKKQGYFTGSRTFLPRQNSNNFVRIQLLPETQAGTVSSSTGGIVNVSGATITFAPASFVTSSGATYNGTVAVKAAYIDPTSAAMNLQMPGDLRGVRTSGEMRGLKSFGMMAVELQGSGGEKLEIKQGMQAVLSFPIPLSLASTAKSTIPLWSYDEQKGVWKEEGVATKTGNNYVGPVTHFSFWNVDEPYEFVYLTMRIVNNAQQPVSNSKVKLTSSTDSSCSFDYTDNNGYVDGFVPKNTTLRRDIYDQCNNIVSTSNIGPFTATTTLPDVAINLSLSQQTITGTVVNCSNLPVRSGFVIINMSGYTAYATVTNGTFSSTFSTCNGVTSASIIAVDDSTQQQSTASTINFAAPVVAAGQLRACGTSTQMYVTVTVDNTSRTWSTAPYWFVAAEDTTPLSGFHELVVAAFDTVNNVGPLMTFLRPQGNFTVPGNVNLEALEIFDPIAPASMNGDYYLLSTTQQPRLTEYGPVGSHVAGSFSGRFVRNAGQVTDTVNVTCTFRVKREPW